ncbi:MAG TPA: PAS domain-containing protein [Afipia sp.]
MKHAANREFYSYWEEKRAGGAAPERSDFEPGHVRHLLGDIFVLSYDTRAGHPFRVAGTRLCALLGQDLKGQTFTDLFGNESRREIEDIIGIVVEETQPTVAGVTAEMPDRTQVQFELLLLPFSARSHTPLSLTGLLAPFDTTHLYGSLGAFSLTSWRHIERPRALRKWSIIRGLTVYEGLR